MKMLLNQMNLVTRCVICVSVGLPVFCICESFSRKLSQLQQRLAVRVIFQCDFMNEEKHTQ